MKKYPIDKIYFIRYRIKPILGLKNVSENQKIYVEPFVCEQVCEDCYKYVSLLDPSRIAISLGGKEVFTNRFVYQTKRGLGEAYSLAKTHLHSSEDVSVQEAFLKGSFEDHEIVSLIEPISLINMKSIAWAKGLKQKGKYSEKSILNICKEFLEKNFDIDFMPCKYFLWEDLLELAESKYEDEDALYPPSLPLA